MPEIGLQLSNSGLSGKGYRSEPCDSPTEKRWFRMTAAGLSGEVLSGAVVMHVNITAQKQAEEERHKSEERYRAIFENSPLPMWILDKTTGGVLSINDAALRLYGYTAEEFAQTTPIGLLPVDSEVEHGPTGDTCQHLSKDGSRLLVEMKVHEMEIEGKAVQLVLVNDVTELHKAEELLRQSQKMEAIGRLAGGVAHDFNNLLSVILGYGSMLLEELPFNDPRRDDLQEICKAGERGRDLTRQLLMFSRQQIVRPKVLNLNEVVSSAEKMLKPLLGEDVDLIFLPGSSLGLVWADRGSLEQVLVNLAVNARDAMPTGGRLTIETGNVVLGEVAGELGLEAQARSSVSLQVTDTGTGMDLSTIARIFEPFFTTKEVGKGTGLGLSTVFGIVKQSGGNVFVESEPGQGSTFRVCLPRVDAPLDSDPEVRRPESIVRGEETILLVEDDDQVRLVTSSILGRYGYVVLQARNGGEALLISEDPSTVIDLVLSDVVMPGMSGPQLFSRLATQRPEMKVICMSGYLDNRIVRDGVLDAQIPFLQKPVTPDVLLEKVRSVLDSD